jgi:hypothetical protein
MTKLINDAQRLYGAGMLGIALLFWHQGGRRGALGHR